MERLKLLALIVMCLSFIIGSVRGNTDDHDLSWEYRRMLKPRKVSKAAVGEACGLPCKNCNTEVECDTGLSCVYNPTGCQRGYAGVCLPNCGAPGRNASACAAVGEHCTFYTKSRINCGAKGGFGCKLNINRYVFNVKQTCSTIPCQNACTSFSACKWNAANQKCEIATPVSAEPTPPCWSDCPDFPPRDPNENTCPECDNIEYEYETPENAFCWNFIDNRAINANCYKTYKTAGSCNGQLECQWTFPKPAGGCAVDGGCHVYNSCLFKCPSSCNKYPKRCRWVEGLGCRHLIKTSSPTPSPTLPTSSPTLPPSKSPTNTPTPRPGTKFPTRRPTKFPTQRG